METPFPKVFWLLHDASNSNERSRNYCWWFETKKLALSYKRHHKKMGYAVLTGPVRVRQMPTRRT